MYRRTVHRGITALALVTILTAAGASPAAAAPEGIAGRLAGALSAATGTSSHFLDRLVRWFDTGQTARKPRSRTTAKLSWGIDPNGNAVDVDTADPQPVAPGPGNN